MIPDLGKYSDAVLSSYAASIVFLAALVGITLWRGRKARAALDEIEKRTRKNG